ncbi:hypothetical protein Ciccas_012278 [Cichlidogyrus casuarinus]|uniref:Uncharacterized protein n=1 Tax=Cichlidogyrus casuarinus TaxID=1844966 RepID=A0ABD2PQ28_9PLAT
MAAYAPKQKKKKKGKAKAKKPGKNPLDICQIPEQLILRRLDGGPPIMYIPKFDNFTDTERFDEGAAGHPLQDDSKWYLEAEPRRYIHMNEAAKYGDLASMQLALAEGYSVDTRDKWYKTPLMIAAQFGHLEMVQYLLQLGANVNAQDNFKWTPLHHAAHGGMIDVVELLLKHGATLEAKALSMGTPLNRAVETSRYHVVELLVRHGAKILSENRKGNTILDNSFHWADPRVIDLLQEKINALPASQKDKKAKVCFT